MHEKWRTDKRILLAAVKMGIGSSIAIYAAEHMHLEHASSAGIIALLTLMTTKWQTMKLSLSRLVSFGLTAALCALVFSLLSSEWIAYGVLICLLALLMEALGWRAAFSVNAVIASHLFADGALSAAALRNELLLVLIGISIAIILNLFHDNQSHRKSLIANMRYAEEQMQMLLHQMAAYLSRERMQHSVWEDICALEDRLQGFIREAYEYQENTFPSHPAYYISYFEMRHSQCQVLHNLHSEMRKIRTMPAQAKVVAGYLLYLTDYVVEYNEPVEQKERLEQIFETMRKEALPESREEFEGRAILYHIMMDIEDFLIYKERFIRELNEVQREKYWKRGGAGKE